MVEERDRWYWHAGTLGAHPATVCFPKAIAFDKGEGSFFTQFMRRTTALSFKNIRTPAMITSVCEISLESKSSDKRHIVPKISIAWSRKFVKEPYHAVADLLLMVVSYYQRRPDVPRPRHHVLRRIRRPDCHL